MAKNRERVNFGAPPGRPAPAISSGQAAQGKRHQPPAPAHQRPAALAPQTVQLRSVCPPAAPPVYRPQPVPKVLQRKTAHLSTTAQGNRTQQASRPTPQLQPLSNVPRPRVGAMQAPVNQAARGVAPHLYRPQPVPRVLQAKTNGGQVNSTGGIISTVRAPSIQQQRGSSTLQLFSSSVVQAVKYYPNLHPGAATPVDRSNIFTLDSFADQYRLRRMNSHGVNVPNMKYNFVRTKEGQTRLHSRYRHPSLAEGQQVLYAGEAYFNNGKLQWWSNGSGHYQPDDDNADQAALPMDYFYSYQQIIKGEHLRKRNETGG